MRPAQLVVFVDALGPEQSRLFAGAGLGLAHEAALRGVLGYSSGAIPTILTGVSPSRHGRMCLFAKAAGSSPLAPLAWLGLLPRIVHERARVRGWVGRVFAAARGYDGYFALHRVPPSELARLDTPEREDLFRAREIGGAPTIFQRARDAGLRVSLTSWRARERDRVRAIEDAPDADLAFLYLSGLDAILHSEGRIGDTASEWAVQAARWIERARVAMAHRGARRRDVELLVIGDHGMAEVTRVIDPRPVVRALRELGRDRFLFVDSTMIRTDERGGADATRAILGALPGVVLDAAALAARDAPPDGRYGDQIALLPEGTLFAPSFVGGRARGMHGYDRGSPSSRAALLADSPLPSHVGTLEDVAPLIARRLGLDAGAAPSR